MIMCTGISKHLNCKQNFFRLATAGLELELASKTHSPNSGVKQGFAIITHIIISFHHININTICMIFDVFHYNSTNAVYPRLEFSTKMKIHHINWAIATT